MFVNFSLGRGLMIACAIISSRITRWGYPLLIALIFSVLVWQTWRKWGNPLVDYGIELYVAWQLSEGKHLYKDIAWLGGPLSQYINALWFRFFGVSYLTLSLVNIAFVAGLTAVLYYFFTQTIGRTAGFVASLTMLVGFAFQSYEIGGSWDYIAPYRHEAVHGLELAILGLSIFADYIKHGGTWRSFGIGLCFGAVCLTKIEPSVALAGALAGGYWLGFRYLPLRRERWQRDVSWFIFGSLIVPLGFAIYLATQMPLALALTGLLGNWLSVKRVNTFGHTFYWRVTGLDQGLNNSLLIGVWLGGFAIVALVIIGLERVLRGVLRDWKGLSSIIFLSSWILSYEVLYWNYAFRLLPFLTGLTLLWLIWMTIRCTDQTARVQHWIPLTAWCVFALLLFGKIVLNTHISNYGFTLAMPATVLLAAASTSLLPKVIIGNNWGDGVITRWVNTGVLVAFFLVTLENSAFLYSWKIIPLGTGDNRMFAFGIPTGRPKVSDISSITSQALQDMAQILPPKATLVVIPDGIILNYLLRRENPTPYTVFDPIFVGVYGGEKRVAETLTAHPPDYIALVQRNFDEYGLAPFGQDPRFGRTILAWVDQHYEVVQVYGAPPSGRDFGIALLRRKSVSSGEAVSQMP